MGHVFRHTGAVHRRRECVGVYEWAWVWAGGRNGGGFFDILTRKMKSRDPGIDVAPPHARYLLPLMEINPQLALEMGNMKGSVRRPPHSLSSPFPLVWVWCER